ncbi:MAG: ABC transporter permease subunit [Candidatus Izemoplasmatales bacterium]
MTNSTANKEHILMKKTAMTLTAIFLIFIGWIILYFLVNHPLLCPSPWAVFQALIGIFSQRESLIIILMTLFRLLLALLASTILGVGLGYVASQKKNLERLLHPVITILRTIPVISILVIMMILLGLHLTPYLITFLMIFPLVYQATIDSVHAIDSAYLDIYHLDDDRWISGFRHCYFPLIRGRLTTAFLQSAGLGIKVLAMAEYFTQTPNSIGMALNQARVNLEYDRVFAWTLCLIFLAVLLEGLVRHHQKKIGTD